MTSYDSLDSFNSLVRTTIRDRVETVKLLSRFSAI